MSADPLKTDPAEGDRAASDARPGQRPSWWSFRIWTGMTARVWYPLLLRHRFRVSPSRLHAVLAISFIGLITAVPSLFQRLLNGRKVAAEVLPPPIFIVGHWRSGTTLLHELLATDLQLITPTYLESFATDHFLRSGGLLRRFDRFIPDKRPMDDVAMGWDRPQEDEFALLVAGAPSPYEIMLFPNDRGTAVDHLDIASEPEKAQDAWRSTLLRVMKRVALSRRRKRSSVDPEPLNFLLKSPTHTARIGLLRQMFPDARFIHVVRSPFDIVPSTERLWREMFASQGFQKARYEGTTRSMTDFVNASARSLYHRFEEDIAGLPAGSWTQTRYEELVQDPIGEVERIRRELAMPAADANLLRQHLAELGTFRRNLHQLDPSTTDFIRRDWAWYFERFGYSNSPPG